MVSVTPRCLHCKKKVAQTTGSINRAIRLEKPLFCSRACSGAHRRTTKTKTERAAEKREYDRIYRAKNRAAITEKKAKRHKETYDPATERVKRKARMQHHVEYCRRPEYREKKRVYDREHLATKTYGDFAEAALLLRDIESEIEQRASRYDIYSANGTLNKALRRRRDLWQLARQT